VYLIFKCCFSKAGSKKLQTVDEKYVEIELWYLMKLFTAFI
jgi:hypothetical protein